jgi:hypothetical protein
MARKRKFQGQREGRWVKKEVDLKHRTTWSSDLPPSEPNLQDLGLVGSEFVLYEGVEYDRRLAAARKKQKEKKNKKAKLRKVNIPRKAVIAITECEQLSSQIYRLTGLVVFWDHYEAAFTIEVEYEPEVLQQYAKVRGLEQIPTYKLGDSETSRHNRALALAAIIQPYLEEVNRRIAQAGGL